MKLLATSVEDSGFTMPIVGALEEPPAGVVGDYFETVDGFHRGRVGKENDSIRASTRGRLPVVRIRADRGDRIARIAATVQHNRARGEHRVQAMSELVREMYQAGERDEAIQRELGMDPDEVRRLKQITGLAELFADRDFSAAWEPVDGPS
jgi:ParB-like chromosome segregation protein Spo0J